MIENRGRPTENTVKPDKWILDTGDAVWHYDVNKNTNGCYKVVHKIEGKLNKPEINQRMYGKAPVVMVFKTSNRSNARTKVKIYKTKNVDEVIEALENDKLPGVPTKAEVIGLGVGESIEKKYKEQYSS